MATPGIFISYRREDTSGHAGRLFDRLVERFGRDRIFRDFETVAAGDDFVEALRRRIAHSDVVLVLIGPRWLTATNEEGQWRLADENDWVRTEIEAALERNIRVIPVLVQGAAMPRAKDLPAGLARLAHRNAIEIRDASFDQDVRTLLDQLGPTWRHRLGRVLLRRPVYAVVAVLLAALLGVWIYPYVALTPDRARVSLGQMGLPYDDETLVRSAAKNDLQVVRLFLAAGMPLNTGAAGNALRRAAQEGHFEMVKLLFERGARDDRALAEAVAPADERKIFDFLLAHQPNKAAIAGALRRAAGTSHTDRVKLLLERGADVNAKSSTSWDRGPLTALHAAARAWRLDCVHALLAAGADVNAHDNQGRSPLMLAVRERASVEIVRLLLAAGASPNATDRHGWSALMYAARSGHADAARELLGAKANPSIRNDEDQDALMIATEAKSAEIVKLLSSRPPARSPALPQDRKPPS